MNQNEIPKIKVSTNAEKAPLVPISLERFLVTDFKDKEIFILKLSGLTLQEVEIGTTLLEREFDKG